VIAIDKHVVETLAKKHGFDDFKWISGKDIVVKQWVRFKCRFMCETYGDKLVCPPHMPPIPECKQFFDEYEHALIIRKTMKAHRRDEDSDYFKNIDKNLMALEKKLFFNGFEKVMVLPATICSRCEVCAVKPEDCHHPNLSRPTPEALGVDVFTTVKKIGFKAEVLNSFNQDMNRYMFMMIA